ncbi:hypothetical protein BUALT_Bualt03G0055400 [Buddleja alternifolia]|uniref:Uncharacterized protein n=1 Tax=Buddleja alternifolia TaxID=168488 RepID=A0AAV6XR87_9LAMI|nr:hypothetical protein BUALT_Bualt03G0055400 [Buddleja alternifolia]
MALSTRKGIFNLSKAFLISESHRFPRVFSLNSSSQPSEEQDAGELFRKGAEGESHKDIEAVSDVGNRVHEITENIKETAQESMERTGQKIQEISGNNDGSTESGNERDLKRKDDESILEGPEDEERLKKKLEKEKGGKPVDEDKGLDVNWRPIDENKSPSH